MNFDIRVASSLQVCLPRTRLLFSSGTVKDSNRAQNSSVPFRLSAGMLESSPLGRDARVDDHFRALVESHQSAVRVHCYRMLGSLQDAEDLTQETLLRAWRSLERYEGRGSVRGWLYRIATNACLDELQHRRRRVLPSLVGAATSVFVPTEPIPAETPWLEPFPDAWLEPAD